METYVSTALVRNPSQSPPSVLPATASLRYHRLMAAISAIILMSCAALVPMSRVQIPLADSIQSVAGVLMFILIAWYCHWSGHRRLREFCLYFLWISCICTGLVILVAVAATAPTPLVDTKLADVDARLGIQTPLLINAAAHFPWLSRTLSLAYNLSGYFALVAILAPAVSRRTAEFQRALLSGSITGILTIALFSLFPAIGPWVTYGFRPSNAQLICEKSLLLLKSGKTMSVSETFAIVSFPSFHVALAVLCALILWNFRPLRIPSTILAVAICISTMTTGWHYVVDVVGGVVVSAIAYSLAHSAIRVECFPVDGQPNG